MFNKQKPFQLSDRLRMGVGRKISKISLLKIFTGVFVSLSLILGINAYKLYTDVNNKQSAPTAQVLGISDSKNQTNDNQLSFTSYTVKKGDTLFSIAQQFNLNWTTLATINAITTPFTVNPGQELKVPKQ